MSFHSGIISLIGRPNAGKSTLLNALLKQKVAIVSDKPQTTRFAINAVLTKADYQMIFVDTPGIHKAQHELGARMNRQSYAYLDGVDVICYLVDASAPYGRGDQFMVDLLADQKHPVFLILNKIDKLKKQQLIETILSWQNRMSFAEIIPVSARNNDNLETLLSVLQSYLPEGPEYYPAEVTSTLPIRRQIEELIREQVLRMTQQEVPHSVAVVVEYYEEMADAIEIHARIIAERETQKGILIGHQGQMLKAIGTQSRKQIERLLNAHVRLNLLVSTRKDWRRDPVSLKRFGYDDNEDA